MCLRALFACVPRAPSCSQPRAGVRFGPSRRETTLNLGERENETSRCKSGSRRDGDSNHNKGHIKVGVGVFLLRFEMMNWRAGGGPACNCHQGA